MAKKSSSGQSGGVNFGKGSKVSVKGDVVGRDKVTKTTTTTTTGMSADDVAKLFGSIYQKINQAPKEDQPAIRNAVDVIQSAAKEEAVSGKKPDEATVTMASQSLAMTAPSLLQDVADVALATMASPANGVLTIIRKVLAKIKQ